MSSLAELTGKMRKDSFDRLRLENAYLSGKVEVYERLLEKGSVEAKDFGFNVKEKNSEKS